MMTLEKFTAACAIGLAAASVQVQAHEISPWPADAPKAGASTPTKDAAPLAPLRGATTDQARRVVRDKATGKLRAPTIEELEEEAAQQRAAPARASRSAASVVRVHPTGMRSVELGEEHMVTLKAERGRDGKLVVRHADAAHEHKLDARRHPQQAATE